MTHITETALTRQELLLLWIRRNGLKQVELARHVGVTPITLSRWLRSDRLPSWRVAQLRQAGIPEELLPLAQDIRPGPRSKRNLSSSLASPLATIPAAQGDSV